MPWRSKSWSALSLPAAALHQDDIRSKTAPRVNQSHDWTRFHNFEEADNSHRQLKPHPLPWLVEILNGVEHANFFEQRATEYSKGASRGSWDGSDGVWAIFDSRKTAAHPIVE